MSRKSLAAGVGNNPDTISRVRSANAGSEDTMPLRIIPERCEAMEDDVQSASAEGGHIFNDDPFGLQLADEAEILKPHARAGPREGAIGRASCRESGFSTGRTRWSPYL